MSGFVYAISDGQGAVKIGYAADPIRRVSELAVGRTEPLTLLGMARGTKADERAAHGLLRAFRIRGEWFRHEGLVTQIVALMPQRPVPKLVAKGPSGPKRRPGIDHLERAVALLGGQPATARVVGVKQPSVSYIISRGTAVPAEWCLPIERATEGAVRAHQLRPDLYPDDFIAPPAPAEAAS